jgi:hypothetical protein
MSLGERALAQHASIEDALTRLLQLRHSFAASAASLPSGGGKPLFSHKPSANLIVFDG